MRVLNSGILIESQYNPPIATVSLMAQYQKVFIDAHQHYEKKSFRNRCYICAPQGRFRLTVPLQGGKSQQVAMKDVLISYEEDWQHQHWQSIRSAYNRSPFFEFYSQQFQSIYKQRFESLLQLNMSLLTTTIDLIGLPCEVVQTKKYIEPENTNQTDARSTLWPQQAKSSIQMKEIPYQQVFSDRLPFQANLSILDLLFNKGPQSISYLKEVAAKIPANTPNH